MNEKKSQSSSPPIPARHSQESEAERAIRARIVFPNPLVARFRESMEMNYERWHDGQGYALELLQQASPDEREAIENLVIYKADKDWRDIEALAAMGSERAIEALQRAWSTADAALRSTLERYASEYLLKK